jgi:dihydropyrimidinase
MRIVVENGVVTSPQGTVEQDLLIEGGTITARGERGGFADVSADRRIDAAGLHVLPGVIDPHTHFGLGGEDDWESESVSAAIGGVTSVLNYVMTSGDYDEAIQQEVRLAQAQSVVDFGLHVCPCMPEHLDAFDDYVDDHGVTSFKYFMHFRGSEGAYLDISGSDDGFLFRYLQKAAARPQVTANIHAENIEVVWRLRELLTQDEDGGLLEFEATRPDFVEAEATFRAGMLGAVAGARTYVVHMSSKLGLESMKALRGIYPQAELLVETCPHYLTHTSASPVGVLAKVNPPLRFDADLEALWEGLLDGTIQTVGSDHAARNREAKSTSVWKSPAGMPGAQTILTVLLSEGYHRRGLSLERIVELTATNPADIFGLERKGRLEPGYDADLILVDLDRTKVVDQDTWGHRPGRFNLFEGWEMTGWPVLTMSRGTILVEDGEVRTAPGRGQYLSRTSTVVADAG